MYFTILYTKTSMASCASSLPFNASCSRFLKSLEIPPERVFFPNAELTNQRLANILNTVRRLNDNDLNIIKDVADSLIRNKKNK